MKNISIEKTRGFLNSSIRSVNEEEMKITHCISTNCVDRYSTIVIPKGCDIKHFLKNPVVLWLHNHDEKTQKIPIGRCVELEIKDNEIIATTEFNRNDPLAVKVFNAYRDGFLNAWSIGFMPTQYKEIDEENMEDINKKYGLSVTKENIENAGYWGLYLIHEWELMEYSAVPVPGNPEALNAKQSEDFRMALTKRGLIDEGSDVKFNFQLLAERKGSIEDMKVKIKDSEVRSEEKEVVKEEVEVKEPVVEKEEVEVKEEKEVEEKEVEEKEEEVKEEKEVEEKEEEVKEEPKVEETKEEVEEKELEPEVEKEVKEEVKEKEVEKNTEVKDLEAQVKSLTETVSQLAGIVKSQVESMEEVTKSLDANNIDKIREANQKRLNDNPKAFFSNYLKNK